VLRERYPDAGVQTERAASIRSKLEQKRRIKNAVREYRRGKPGEPPEPPAARDVPVRVRDEGPFVHYPATPADIHAILAAVPQGSLEGLTAVECELGREAQRTTAAGEEYRECAPDPFTGRLSTALLPGIFSGPGLASYHPQSTTIRLYGYVHDPSHELATLLRPYLKLRMLSGVVHELAHHQDFTLRISRGRWRADDSGHVERYAEAEQHELVQKIVVPYLVAAYPEEVAALESWIRHHGGAGVSLATLAGDPRVTRDAVFRRVVFGADVAFVALLENYVRGESLAELRCEFARDLHYGEFYAEALEALGTVLAGDPENLTALTLKADIFAHQERYDDALALATQVVLRNPREFDAWAVLAQVHRDRHDWAAVNETATRALEWCERGSREQRSQLAARARARLELGEYAAMRQDLEPLLAARDARWTYALAVGLQAVMLLREGRFREALDSANNGLAVYRGRFSQHVLLAVRAEAARELGDSEQAEQLTELTFERLRALGYEDWAERLLTRYPDIRAPEPRRRRRARGP
jgi:tetratricopeptide (TPR) repeat protein